MPTAVIPSPRPAADKPNRPADPAVESAAFGKFIKGRVGGKRAKNEMPSPLVFPRSARSAIDLRETQDRHDI